MFINYEIELQKLEKSKQQLLITPKGSQIYGKRLKRILKQTIYLKAHAFCMDNEKERKKMLNLIWEVLESCI